MVSTKKVFADGLYDIRLKNNTGYLHQAFDLKANEIENQIRKINYTGNCRIKDKTVENTKLPPFIVTFYKHLFATKQIPHEDELINAYISEYFQQHSDNPSFLTSNNNTITLDKEGVIARLLRSYPSIIRDFHFYCLIKDSNLFDSVTYSLNADYFDGNDLIIENGNQEFFVSLYLNSSRSKFFKNKKYTRHNYTQIKEITLEISFDELNKTSDFYLYGERHLLALKERIDNYDEEK